MPNFLRRVLVLAVSATCLPGVALAQDEGFAVNRFDPAERGSDWFSQDSLNIAGNGRLAFGFTGDWAHKPLVVYDADGEEVEALIDDQVFIHLGGNVTFFDRLRLGVNVPVAVYQNGNSASVNGNTFDVKDDPTNGDVRVAADVRIVGKYREPASLAAGVRVYLPTGSQDAYTGDGELRVAPRLLLAGDIGQFVYAANAGFYYRGQDQTFAGTQTGSEIFGGAALGARVIDDKLIFGPELYFSTVVEGDAAFERATTPFEVLFGAHYLPTSELRLGAGFGPGLTRGIGAPEFRGLISLDWIADVEKKKPLPPPPPADKDGDGVLDSEDACVDVPGVRTEDPKTNGCPPPKDTDGDTVMDPEDACVDVPGVPTEDPKTNGCPPPDRDKDTILDPVDACPDEPGEKSDDPAKNGCPKPKDTDGDGIIDPEDACPEAAGPANSDPKKNGCPAARIEKGQIKILERVEFKYNSAELTKESEPILQAVYDVISAHPEFNKLSVEGHTDDKGNDKYNKNLSQRRAQSVVTWFTKKGIDKKRLSAVGWGEERPLDTNATEEGRQNNRRVEFHILEVDGKAVPQEPPPTPPPPPPGAEPAKPAKPEGKAAPAAPKPAAKPAPQTPKPAEAKPKPKPNEPPPKVDFSF